MAEQTQTLRFQGAVNLLVRGLLRLPLVSRGIGRRLITLYVVGRRSGKRYTVPVAYTWHGNEILIGTPFAWARNLRTGSPVDVRYLGRRRTADVRVETGESEVVAAYEVIARDNRNFAGFNNIGYAADGTPNAEDLHRCWTQGARVIYLSISPS
ncbi:hypothetical protein GCM10010112_76410 [Actinoplanes lobatus]|uniref:Uncharacterized protein n=1 Tax=Actinoplanes lobatus TaxID=113568 RepID=A0A7W7MJJ9_9ACTN|nr:hypothetical protein [Actinoplanes lobatus]MBB4752732.1 hypothetical protein [Actinoplanes lobatus]GGN90736.1 hypothetical protein GCM10010112_76410 [Actinoplanes lobatus]GIE43931.1 hypothetical protein Alo02nite_68290 [Actinoplanes lobatus]